MYHRQVKMMDVYMSRILLEFLGVSASFVALGLGFWAIDWIKPPEDWLIVVLAWLLLAWFGAALALTLGALSERYEIVDKLWSPATLILFPLSGAAFMAEALPAGARDILLYLPMLHGVEYLREGFFGSVVRTHYDLGYLVVCNAALTFFGLSQVKRVALGESAEF